MKGWMLCLLVFLGGGLGSCTRYLIARTINSHYSHLSLPLATLLANGLGCFIIGFALVYIERHLAANQNWSLFIATGFCGGLTTFSSFAYEHRTMIGREEYFWLFVYLSTSLILGIGAVFLGMYLARIV